MRLLAIASVGFILALSVNAKDVSKPDSEQNKPQHAQSTPDNPSTRIEINIDNQPKAAPSQPQEQQSIPETKPAPITHGEWLIAAITAAYVVISFFMLRAIKKQAKAAEGELAAQSPWIMVNIEYTPGMLKRVHGTTKQGEYPEVQHTDFIFRFDCINHGKTPALITEKRAVLILVPKDTLPKKPDLGRTELLDERVEPLASGQPSLRKVDKFLSVIGYQGLDDWLVIYGAVKYIDVFGRNRQTTFGYRITLGDELERLSGRYPEYNKNA